MQKSTLNKSNYANFENLHNTEPQIYKLMSKDNELLTFKYDTQNIDVFEVLNINYENVHLLPWFLKSNIRGLSEWFKHRPITTNREHIEKVLESIKLTEDAQPFDYLKVNSGFSLNDCYWLKVSDTQEFASLNLYTNKFNEALGAITFFGNMSDLGGTIKSPEITTQGFLGKAWRQEKAGTFLYKKGTSGYANSGFEPYSEYLASNVAYILKLDHVHYDIVRWKGILCSKCKLFTDLDNSFLNAGEYLKSAGLTIWNYSDVIQILPKELYSEIHDMMVFDFIIENKDRHFGNFGFMRDTNTGELLKLAPMFDNGCSLLCYEMDMDFEKGIDYNTYTTLGTFNVSNRVQVREALKHNPRKYLTWAKELKLHVHELRLQEFTELRNQAIHDLILNRANFIENFCKEM